MTDHSGESTPERCRSEFSARGWCVVHQDYFRTWGRCGKASAGAAATDVDSTAEVSDHDRMFVINEALANVTDTHIAAFEAEVSAGSPVTAGVPDTAALRAKYNADWGTEPCIRALCDALDAARGELVTARGERDSALVVVRGHRGQIVELRAELAAANARIAAVRAICDDWRNHPTDCAADMTAVCDCALADIANLIDAGVPTAGDNP